MTLRYFEGPAGTGKTTSLIDEVRGTLVTHPLGADQKVLALTFMHGARRRLAGKLAGVPALRGRFDCLTIDSFAWHLLARWRTRAVGRWGVAAASATELDFDRTCHVAGGLLALQDVCTWVAKTYPIVVVDEAQDCRDGRLVMLQALASHARVLVAADGFQDLTANATTPGVDWLRSEGSTVPLTTCHRTSKGGLLAGANALRSHLLLGEGVGLKISSFPTAELAVNKVATELYYYPTVLMLSPTTAPKSTFVRTIIARLGAAPVHIKSMGKDIGPFKVLWQPTQEDEIADLLARLSLPANPDALVPLDTVAGCDGARGATELREWARQQARLRGAKSATAAEVHYEVQRAVHRARAHRAPSASAHRVMTIHQAKNQEFREVVVFWPYQIKGDAEQQRRLLYNAITRARERAVIVVQNNPSKQDRLKLPPFAP